MSLPTDLNKVQYAIVGGVPAASYAITFRYFAKSDIKVLLTNPTGDVLLAETTNYTLTAPGVSGTLTPVGTWDPTATQVTIYRAVPVTQTTDLANGAKMDAEVVELMNDRIVAIAQQLEETILRQVTVPISDPTATLTLPPKASRANQFLGFDSLGNIIAAMGMAPVAASVWIATNLLSAGSLSYAQNALGISAFVKTLIDDQDAAAFLTTLGIPATTTGKAALAAVANTIVANFKAETAGDADKVSAAGIGLQAVPIMATSYDGYRTSGIYKDPGSIGGPWGGGNLGRVLVLSQDANYCTQVAFRYGYAAGSCDIKFRNYANGNWGAWYYIWNADTDSNGGTGPAAKQTVASSGTIGYIQYFDVAASASAPTQNWGGQVLWEVVTYGGLIGGVTCGIAASNGGNIGTANINLRYKLTRYA